PAGDAALRLRAQTDDGRSSAPGAAVGICQRCPRVIIERCSRLRTRTGVETLTDSDRARMLQASVLMANDALRVLALAERPLDQLPSTAHAPLYADGIERDMVLLGLIGLQDPPRPEALDAVRRCKRAGIRTVMITGDHPD